MARSSSDVVGFTRIFVLFCTLVLLPAMLMSGFGVVAILNERAAEKQRRREQAIEVLRRAESQVIGLLDASDREMRARASGAQGGDALRRIVEEIRGGGRPVGPVLVLGEGGQPLLAEGPFAGEEAATAALRERVQRLARSLEDRDAAHVTLEVDGFSGVISMQALPGDRLVAYAVDVQQLDRALREAAVDDDMIPSLRVVEEQTETPVIGALDRLMAEVERLQSAEKTVDDDAPEELATTRLGAPFERLVLAVTARPSSAARTTVVVYLVLLLVFYGTLITGVVITARLIWQETRISRLKTDFVSHVSHELRTPLTSIRMFIETLKLGRARSPEEQQECLDLLTRETERLSEMIERVLGYARLRAGRRPFHVAAVDVDTVVEEAIEAFRAHTLGADASKLVLSKDVPAGLPPVLADRDALVEALLNLVGNAWKYTGPDKRIRVFARQAKRGVVIGVEDNGPGLPKAEHKRIFERFYQAGSSLLSKKTEGSGLGLAITRAIVEGQGGRISVESEPGRGATFLLELPTPKKS